MMAAPGPRLSVRWGARAGWAAWPPPPCGSPGPRSCSPASQTSPVVAAVEAAAAVEVVEVAVEAEVPVEVQT